MSILFKTLTGLNSEPAVPEVKPLTLRNVGTNSANVSITQNGSPTVDGLQYRMEGEKSWLSYTIGTEITVNPNKAVQFQNTNETLSTNTSNFARVVLPYGTKFNAEGNIQSMLNYSDSVSEYCFYNLFRESFGLVDASQLELSATTLANNCYDSMFLRCTSLVNGPVLPATTLAAYCYNGMFIMCTSLVNEPVLPATTLAEHCYSYMFQGCSSLVNAPALPATTLAIYCYQRMFFNCTGLVNAPTLPATTLASRCYSYMFQGCTSLVNAPELPARYVQSYCYQSMFQGCTSLVNAPELPAYNVISECYNGMFRNCTSLVNPPTMAKVIKRSSSGYGDMFNRMY